MSLQFGITQTIPRPFFKKKSELYLNTVDYSEDDYLQRLAWHADIRPTFSLLSFEPNHYCTQDFDNWWRAHHAQEFMDVATISQHLTGSFSYLLQKFKKGISKHIKEIQAFQKYFETVYDPNDLS